MKNEREQSARDKLLYDRAEAGHMLGDISTSTLVRWEEAGNPIPDQAVRA